MKENEAGVLKGKVNFKQLADKTGKAMANVAQGVGKGAVSIVDKTKKAAEKSQRAILDAIDQNGNGEIDIEDVIIMGLKVPGIRIDRELFLRKELQAKFPSEMVDDAVAYNPLHAKIPTNIIDGIADEAIKIEEKYLTIGCIIVRYFLVSIFLFCFCAYWGTTILRKMSWVTTHQIWVKLHSWEG